MRKFLVVLVLCLSVFRSVADEGMWLPMLLGQQVYNDMAKKGLKLTKEQLYSVNKASLKDAIIIFSGFCTGEIVSNEGLIFTNHHCGYGAIAAASTVQNNYLKNGFWAKSKPEEIPAQGLYAEFLIRIDDVTKEVEEAAGNATGAERTQKVQAAIDAINRRNSDESKSIYARASSLFKGNQFLLFVYQRYKDIRLVGTPAESIGKFGGDTDNWEWPRHTGDFSIFRVYADASGQPAAHSPSNVPLKPKHYLPISLKGVRDGDFAMIWGYPGSTNRYETSVGIKQKIEVDNPSLVKLRDMRLKYMFEEMSKDPKVKLKLASDYASIANYWKFYDGESKQLVKYDVYGQKKKLEDAFTAWAKGKPEYENIFTEWPKAYEAWRPYSKHRVFINEGIIGSPLMAFASTLQQVESAIVREGSSDAIKKAVAAADKARTAFLETENQTSDRNILARALEMFYNEIDKTQHPIGFFESIRGSYGDLKEPATYKKYVNAIFDNTMVLNDAKWKAFVANPDATVLQADPAYAVANAFIRNWQSKYIQYFQIFTAKNNELGRLYLKGIRQQDSVKAKMMYPDATFTMRVSYGQVKAYKPRDAVTYDYVTTMKGTLDKYKPGDYEFDLPEQVLGLAQRKDYGQYIDKQRNDLVVGFITTNDITGGNSGSPVINGNGELIGLAFDGNYEALSHKIAFDKDLNRTICVDVRYVLWCIDKVGNAQNIIKELKLVK